VWQEFDGKFSHHHEFLSEAGGWHR
jgi:hypothetical protein